MLVISRYLCRTPALAKPFGTKSSAKTTTAAPLFTFGVNIQKLLRQVCSAPCTVYRPQSPQTRLDLDLANIPVIFNNNIHNLPNPSSTWRLHEQENANPTRRPLRQLLNTEARSRRESWAYQSRRNRPSLITYSWSVCHLKIQFWFAAINRLFSHRARSQTKSSV
jgi:hypothetical protein